MQPKRISLAGFKSFVEPVELEIGPGMTGIVGPNGCGKSNLVEAVRWIMGETSARSVRAGGMDDVIFDGTAGRPARNVAEIRLVLGNEDRSAPAAFNDSDEIEVTRRIQRERGSVFLVNGREVRARDVQLFFADGALGARSHALVSQGEVGRLVGERPAERRRLLEEAAGVAGIHARRHEAELRLRAAEANLERLDEALAGQRSRLAELRRQARQAARYRSLSGRIRAAEARMGLHRWREARDAERSAQAALAEAEAAVERLTAEAAAAAARQAGLQADLPPLREAEAEAAAALHRLAAERSALAEEGERLGAERARIEADRGQAEGDLERERRNRLDVGAEAKALEEERGERAASGEGAAPALEEARAALEGARARAREAAEAEAEAARALARAESSAQSRAREAEQRAGAIERLDERIRGVEAEVAGLPAGGEGPGAGVAEADRQVQADRERAEAAGQEETRLRGSLAEAEAASSQAADARRAAERERAEAEAGLGRLRAEEEALSAVVASGHGEDSVAARIEIEPGFERAVAAALGDDINASVAEAPVRWRDLGDIEGAPLPGGAQPLSSVVKAPPQLRRRLERTGIVESDQGDGLQKGLLPGQRLVDRSGALWRWDGYAHTSEDSTPVSRWFQQRNRLAEVRGLLKVAAADIEARHEGEAEAVGAADRAGKHLRAVRGEAEAAGAALREASLALSASQEARARALADDMEARARPASLRASLARLQEERQAQEGALEEARKAAEEDPGTEPLAADAERLRGETAEARAAFDEALARKERLEQAEAVRADRVRAIDAQLEGWARRGEEADRQIAELERRIEGIGRQARELADRPARIESGLAALAERISEAEARQREAGDARAGCENELRGADGAAKEAEGRLSEAREARARLEGQRDQAAQALRHEEERIAERLQARADELESIAGLAEGEALPPVDELQRTLERLERERENVGSVNLRAEEEAEELAAKIDETDREREELVGALNKLRHAIGSLNREARERLRAAFGTIDGHFRAVFTRLFGGGEARLELVDSDDPLEAGLDLVASPPGKRLQKLSLLSGGEKALAALSLLFAMFLTRPAPLCVLDEVDAPLDDSNVDRFCSLLKEIVETSGARLVVVTHHRLTMARMDRLYGVTMREPGVSSLVSVNLAHAEGLREAG